MRSSTRFQTGALLLVACAGAGTSPGGDEESSRLNRPPLIQTDRSSYTVERGESHTPDGTPYGRYVRVLIPLRYTNSTESSIYLPTCNGINPPLMQKKEGNRWVIAFAPIVQACLGSPQVIQPGNTFEYEYEVEGYEPGGRVMPQFITEVPGTYRLVWDAYATWNGNGPELGLGLLVPLENRISNEFGLTEQRK